MRGPALPAGGSHAPLRSGLRESRPRKAVLGQNPHRMATIGLSLSLSGSLARQGRQAMQGLLLWAADVNGRGGLAVGSHLSRVEVRCEDDASRAGEARECAGRLMDDRGVAVCFAPYGSHLAVAAAEEAKRRGRILWNHGGASDDVDPRTAIPVLSAASAYFRGLPGLLTDVTRALALAAPRGTFARHVVEGLQATAPWPIETASLDDPPSLRGIDLLVLAGGFDQEVALLRSIALPPHVAAVSAGIAAFGCELGSRAEGVIGPSQWEPMAGPVDLGPCSEAFVRAFRERFGEEPEYPAAGAYAAGLILEACVSRAGSLDEDRLRAEAERLDVRTFYGRFRLDPATGRQVGHAARLVQWRDGVRSVVG